MTVDKFGRRAKTVKDKEFKRVCKTVKRQLRKTVQSYIELLQLRLQEEISEIKITREEELRRLAAQLFHWINKIHTTVPPARIHATLDVDDQTFLDWDKIFTS